MAYYVRFVRLLAMLPDLKYYSVSIITQVFSYKLRYIAGFGLVEMAISTNPKPTIYRNLYENTGPVPEVV